MQAQMWMIQPSVPKLMNQTTPAPRKKMMAERIRPWVSCPSPGKNRLHSEAMTFPADPRPVLIRKDIRESSGARKRNDVPQENFRTPGCARADPEPGPADKPLNSRRTELFSTP